MHAKAKFNLTIKGLSIPETVELGETSLNWEVENEYSQEELTTTFTALSNLFKVILEYDSKSPTTARLKATPQDFGYDTDEPFICKKCGERTRRAGHACDHCGAML